jgi:hypothetical protein
MVGLPRYAISVIVAMQTLVHSTPGWAAGLGLSVFVLHFAFGVFSSLTGLHISFGISPFSFFVSAIYGLLVPLIVCSVIVAGAMRASIVAGLQARGAVHTAVITIARASERLSAGTLRRDIQGRSEGKNHGNRETKWRAHYISSY